MKNSPLSRGNSVIHLRPGHKLETGSNTAGSYNRLRKAIADELLAGAERVKQVYREEIVRRVWNIGRLLRKTLGLGDKPSAENAALIARLCKDFHRPDTFFYDAAKFHRLYPAKAPLALSMSHYSLLMRVKDPKKRLALQNKAIAEGINAKDFRMYTRTLSRPGLEKLSKTGSLSGSKRFVLPLERGRLYHYRAANAPANGRVLIDIGFGVEREVRYNSKGSLHSGLIIRAERISPGLNFPLKNGSQDGPIPPKGGMKGIGTGEDYFAKISPFKKERLYTYAATLDRVIDGDTIIARVDLGFRTWKTETFRLRGIDAPEMTCALGKKAKAEVVKRLTPCSGLVIKTYKQEKFGRFLADVFYKKGTDDREQILREGAFLNQELLDEGLAVPYEET
jgi:endonuclease YncB( thermonuclease family)